jgi:KaiC/GvpD/RAD55 family RecA-like ATPase/DNA-binding NarL/FixJ family response regulator
MDRDLVGSGNLPLDRQIGGFRPHRPYLVSGNPGTGKSVSCLEFLDVAIERNERAVLLTHDDPTDVLATGDFLGIPLDEALRDERLILLRFQLDFVRRLGRAVGPDEVFAELRRLIGPVTPTRLAIDSVVPFLEGGAAGSAVVFGLAAFLDELGATSLLTYPGDLAGLYDRRLEPLMQRAGGFFHLTSLAQGRRRGQVEIRKLRYEAPSVAPVRFRIEPGAGFVQDGEPNDPEEHLAEELHRRVLLVNLQAPFRADLLRSLERTMEVTVRSGLPAAFSDLVRSGVGVVLLNLQRDVVRDGVQLVRELRRADVRTPIVVVTPYNLRSTDRTRALRAGADDFLSLGIADDEFAARVTAIARRGRSSAVVETPGDLGLLAQPRRPDGAFEVLPARAFETAVRAYLDRARAPFFTLVTAGAPDG